MRAERGFTLVEVLIASSVLTMVLIAVTTLFILAAKMNTAAGDKTECVALAQERLERLKNKGYDALTAGGDLLTLVNGYHQYVDVDSNGNNDYLVTWKVVDNSPMSGSKELRARALSLKGANAQLGPPKQVTFYTYKAKGGSV